MNWIFAPGVRIKRYFAVIGLGFLMIGITLGQWRLSWTAGYTRWDWALFAGVGLIFVIVGTRAMWQSLTGVMAQDPRWSDRLYSRRPLTRGPKVVVLGGGTGIPAVLRGMKKYTANITAIVTVADDGGSSGRLRGDFNMLPPGDLRNCLVALADAEPLMEDLFQFRFRQGELAGHSFGNLFLAAMEQSSGDFVTALRESSRVLAVRGTVLPATLDHVELCAELDDGRVIRGESLIGQSTAPIRKVWLDPPDATPLHEAVEAISQADLIVLGPGSLYTSILPNVLVEPIADALRRAAGLKVYVANIMTQPGETEHFTIADHVKALEDHAGPGIIDVVLANTEPVPPSLLERYQAEGAEPVSGQVQGLVHGPSVVYDKLLLVDHVARHDPDKLARSLLRILLRQRPHWAEGHMMDALWLENRLRERRQGKWNGPTHEKLKQK
ncbi:MAG: YvcK family protein [Firmicutes bacterium]|nr:YvcK family protein [Bacillota bacterium]